MTAPAVATQNTAKTHETGVSSMGVHEESRNDFTPENTGLSGTFLQSTGTARLQPESARKASALGVRLPNKSVLCTPARMRRWLRKLELTPEWYTEYTGFKRLDQWIAANPEWTLREFVGLLLEES